MSDYRSLPPDQKRALINRWTHEGRAVFEAIPDIAGLFPRILEVQVDLDNAAKSVKATAELETLSEEIRRTDALIDDGARGIVAACSGYALWCKVMGRPDVIPGLQALEATLLESGLGLVNLAYLEEVGAVKAALGRLGEGDWALAATLPIGETDLAEWLRTWGRNAERQSDLLQRRAVLMESAPSPSAPSLFEAELAWVREVSLVINVLKGSRAPAELKDQLVAPVVKALKDHAAREARAARSGSGDTGAPAGAPQDVASPVGAEPPPNGAAHEAPSPVVVE